MESDQPHRRRRRRKRRSHGHSSDSSSPKPLSIDLLKKKRHKNAKRVRIASARLDLDEGTTYEGARDRRTFLSHLLAILVVAAGVILILNDIGWGVLRDGLADFMAGVGRGAHESISGGREEQAAALSAQTTMEAPATKKVSGVFKPEGNQEALDKMSLAMDARKVGLTSQALTLLDEAQKADPEVVGVSLLKGFIFKDEGDSDKAVHHFEEALEKPGEKLFAALNLGEIAYEREEFDRAVEYFSMVKKWKADDPMSAHRLSRALRMSGRPMEGLFEAREAHEMFSENKLYEVSARLAAVQAGELSPPPVPAESAVTNSGNRTLQPAIRSPFERVVEAGFATADGDSAKAAEIWEEITVHMDTLPVLKELKQDPIFLLNQTATGEKTSASP